MATLSGKNVLITGASSGIGEALARECVAQGAHVVLLARRIERLENLAEELRKSGTKVLVYSADVSRDHEVERAVTQARETLGPLDLVIANAGFSVAGDFSRLSIEDYRRQFETNVFGVIRTVKACLEDLKTSRGNLGIVGSVNGYVALPGISAYAMSKFSVRALCDALYHEFKPHGISITHIAPGFVISEIRKVDNQGRLHAKARDPIPLWLQMPAANAARKIIRSILNRKRERVVTGHGWWIVRLWRFFPDFGAFVIKTFKIWARIEPESDSLKKRS